MRQKILTHQDLQTGNLDQFVGAVRRRQGRQGLVHPQPAAAPTVKAEVNYGRWIAHCPVCPGAEMVDPEDPRFFCLSCDNAAFGRRMLRVEFPDPITRGVIERLLLARPVPQTRNWLPHETVLHLRQENAAHGVM